MDPPYCGCDQSVCNVSAPCYAAKPRYLSFAMAPARSPTIYFRSPRTGLALHFVEVAPARAEIQANPRYRVFRF